MPKREEKRIRRRTELRLLGTRVAAFKILIRGRKARMKLPDDTQSPANQIPRISACRDVFENVVARRVYTIFDKNSKPNTWFILKLYKNAFKMRFMRLTRVENFADVAITRQLGQSW